MKQERFSIRKTARGAVSARIAVIGLLALLGVGQEVQADVMTPGATTTVSPAGGTTVAGKQETVIIASPVTYVADDTKEVGYHEIRENGQAGSLVITETPGGKTVQRTEPTATTEVFGTKPKVEEVVADKTPTEYVANEELEAGTQVVKQEGQDGKEVTTTTYRLQIQEQPQSDFNNQYRTKVSYTVDESQVLPSDKIKIDESTIMAYLPEIPTGMNKDFYWFRSFSPLNASEGVFYGSSIGSHQSEGEELATSVDAYLRHQVPSDAQYAEIKAAYIRLQEAVKHIETNYQGEDFRRLVGDLGLLNEAVEGISRRVVGLVASDRTNQYVPENQYLHPYTLDNKWEKTSLYKDYLKQLDAAGISYDVVGTNELKLDGVTYTIAAGMTNTRYKAWEEFSDEEVRARFDRWVESYKIAYETQTHRYNKSRGFAEELNLVYETTQMSDEDKNWFEEKIASLPRAIKQNLLRLVVTDEELEIGADFVGQATKVNNQIYLRYPKIGSRENLLRVLLHELAHVIDFNTLTSKNYMSSGKEFFANSDSLYNTVFNPTIDRPDVTVAPYYKDNKIESFAEFFGQYMFRRHFGYGYVKFIEVDGKVLTLRDIDWGETPEEIAENRANYEAYYKDSRAYSPVEAAEWFFADLYTKLFEQPTKAQVVVDKVSKETLKMMPKVIEVGTKSKIEDEVTKYTTLEVEDADLLIGERKVTQVGKDGIVRTTTTYELVDKTTGEVKATTDTSVIQELVQEIIAVGTKPKPVAPSVQPTQPKQPTLTLVQPPGQRRPVITSPQSSDKDGQVAAGTGTSTETPSRVKPAPVLAVAATSPTRTNQSATSTPSLPKTGEAGATALAVTGFGLVLSSLGLARRRKAD